MMSKKERANCGRGETHILLLAEQLDSPCRSGNVIEGGVNGIMVVAGFVVAINKHNE
jgi:hypothetical protein